MYSVLCYYVCRKSQAMRIMRFGQEDYSKMVLDMQASLVGLKGWDDVISEEDKSCLKNASTTASVIETAEFCRAKGETTQHPLPYIAWRI